MKGTLLKSKALTDEWMVRYTTYKTIPGIKGVMGSHSRIPESNYIPMHPDHILYLCPGDNGSVIDFEIIPVCNNCGRDYCDNLACKGESDIQYAKLINEEKSTKRSKQKKHTNIMEHNNVEKLCTNEDPNKLKEMSLNDAVEYLKQNPKESVKVTLSEDERNGINDFFKHYNLNNIYKKDGESEGGRW